MKNKLLKIKIEKMDTGFIGVHITPAISFISRGYLKALTIRFLFWSVNFCLYYLTENEK